MSEVELTKHLRTERPPAEPPASGGTPAGPSTAEGLQLFKAFILIQDATLRSSVIHLVELLAAAAPKR
jgi:hypothetical protein